MEETRKRLIRFYHFEGVLTPNDDSVTTRVMLRKQAVAYASPFAPAALELDFNNASASEAVAGLQMMGARPTWTPKRPVDWTPKPVTVTVRACEVGIAAPTVAV